MKATLIKIPEQKIHSVEWAAGFFEGEGCIRFTTRKKGGRWLTAEVAQVYREPLDEFQKIFNRGKVYGPYGPYSTNRQPYYMYMAYGKDAIEIINKMQPWLFRKGEQASEALAKYEEHVNVCKAS